MATAEHLEADVSTVRSGGLPGHRAPGQAMLRHRGAQEPGSPMHRRMNVPTPPPPEGLHMPPQELSVILNRMTQASRQQAKRWRKFQWM